jgi:hypothetical protein
MDKIRDTAMEIIDSPQRGQCIYTVNWCFLKGTKALKKRSSFSKNWYEKDWKFTCESFMKTILRPYRKINSNLNLDLKY